MSCDFATEEHEVYPFQRSVGIRICQLAIAFGSTLPVIGAEQTATTGTPSECPPSAVETGEAHPQLVRFDQLMREFLRDQQIPGAALAVARQGRLVYARGFGYADVRARQPVQPDSLFRIASISKPITAVAVLFNTSATSKGQAPARKIDSLVHRAANAVEEWPEHDLFGRQP